MDGRRATAEKPFRLRSGDRIELGNLREPILIESESEYDFIFLSSFFFFFFLGGKEVWEKGQKEESEKDTIKEKNFSFLTFLSSEAAGRAPDMKNERTQAEKRQRTDMRDTDFEKKYAILHVRFCSLIRHKAN